MHDLVTSFAGGALLLAVFASAAPKRGIAVVGKSARIWKRNDAR